MNDQLADATRRRSQDTRARAREAIRKLDRNGDAVNYVTVARAANVSRSLLYRDPTLRQEIETLRAPDHNPAPRRPTAQRMSAASREERLASLHDEIRTLRSENRALRERLAAVLGEDRANHTQ
ncbi:MAG: DUF6262 family protein [Corynebacterium sp.]|uniref:DUF6262 family protein n=1 Tax=Corynebacterium sp. TaxID=1720 RepID=UPI00264A0589|nr:DUF6262 family protein [Corynebacterium sp.]MDN5724169.1 DUF6262 family protein [Corynebacterium sp.]